LMPGAVEERSSAFLHLVVMGLKSSTLGKSGAESRTAESRTAYLISFIGISEP